MSQLLAISLPGETWRDIKGQDRMYKISSKGRSASLKNGKVIILKTHQDKNGYLNVTLSKHGVHKRYSVHRLVAETFIPNPNKLSVVHHRDNNPLNNDVSNLEWSTYSQNTLYAVEVSAMKFGEKHHNAKLTEDIVRYIRKVHVPHDKEFGASALARKFDVDVSMVLSAIKGKTWKHVK